ncbi:transporter substrate-binding domain-containing protein [Pigmentibacter sp. JX0631]|uniref:substrate-binding periplasmic protein n=1 Tax=Pigmentibacter sp. JX0631 TaxID=2976982 RepID=UPI00246845A7|nr:transporter substrate-binding domain-containing protein [Pigmentibacter sp. JX0631]WGL61518.1 transporter substrate-binding domain-containing protein [Pigmentibacter sp. JX0631]
MFIKILHFLNLTIIFNFNLNCYGLNILSDNSQYPWIFKNKENLTEGISYEIVKLILKKTKINYNLDFFPWPRAIHLALINHNTCIFPTGRNSKRENSFYWTGIVGSNALSIFSLQNSKIYLKTLHEAKKYEIGVNIDSIISEKLKNENFSNLKEVTENSRMFKMLASNRLDLIAMNRSEALKTAASLNIKIKEILQFGSSIQYLACNKNTDSQIIQKITDEFIKKETIISIDNIYKKYGVRK